MKQFKITYFDNREGDLVRVYIGADNEEIALEEAQEDYYFGKLVDIEEE